MAEPGEGGSRSVHDLQVRGEERSYVLYRPALPEGERVPLMLVLHGGLGNAEGIERTTGMDAVADEGEFLVAYPEGTGVIFARAGSRRTWNAGTCCGPAAKRAVDDVGFLSAVIDDVASRYPVDPDRVYVAGMSNGAMMAYRLACEIPHKLAAIVAVSGTLAVDDCSGSKDVPVLHIHGDADANVPFEGGFGEDGVAGVSHRSVPDTMRLLTEARGCGEGATRSLQAGVDETLWTCSGGAPVRLLVLRGGGHAWPGGAGRRGGDGGPAGFSASAVAWDFAKQFTRKD